MWTLTKEFKDYVVKNNLEQLGSMKIGLLTNPEVLTPEEKYTFVANKVENRYVATATVDSAVNFSRIVILYQENGQGEWTTLGYTDTFIEFEDDSNTKKIEFTFSLDDVQVKDVVYEELFTELKEKIEEATTKYNTEILPLFKAYDHSDNGSDIYKYLKSNIEYYAKLVELIQEFRGYYQTNKFDNKFIEITAENKKEIQTKLNDLNTLLTKGVKGFDVLTYLFKHAIFGVKVTNKVNGYSDLYKSNGIYEEIKKEDIPASQMKKVLGVEPDTERSGGYYGGIKSLITMYDEIKNNKFYDLKNYHYREQNVDIKSIDLLYTIMKKGKFDIPSDLLNSVDFFSELFNAQKNDELYIQILNDTGGRRGVDIDFIVNYEKYTDEINRHFYRKPLSGVYNTLFKDSDMLKYFKEKDNKPISVIDAIELNENNNTLKLLLFLLMDENIKELVVEFDDFKNTVVEHWKANANNHLTELRQRFEQAKLDGEIIRLRNEVLEKLKEIADNTDLNNTYDDIYVEYGDLIKRAINKIYLNKDSDFVEFGHKVENNPYRFTYLIESTELGLDKDSEYESNYKNIDEGFKNLDKEINEYFFVTPNWTNILNEISKTDSEYTSSKQSYTKFRVSEHDGQNGGTGSSISFTGVKPSIAEDGTTKLIRLWGKGLSRAGVIFPYAGYGSFHGLIVNGESRVSYTNDSTYFNILGEIKPIKDDNYM